MTRRAGRGAGKKSLVRGSPLPSVTPLLERVVAILDDARSGVVRAVNSSMVLAYWSIGRELVEFVQRGSRRAEYGDQVLEALAGQLQRRVGRGYSVTNLRYFRLFYVRYQDRRPEIHHSASDESFKGFSDSLSWTHYRVLSSTSSGPAYVVARSGSPLRPRKGSKS
ncbi:MAG: hypothetical protein RL653_3451 [Pseudomonadota bacterium]|jgi:hypothetical protein